MTENLTPSVDHKTLQSDVGATKRPKSSWKTNLFIVLLIVCAVLGAALWFAEKRFETANRSVASQLQTLRAQIEATQQEAKKTADLAESQADRIVQLETSLRTAQEQFDALEQAWQTFNNGMDKGLLLNDVDRLLTLANQQLRLAGNVNSAIMALETALAELVRSNHREFASLQRAISLDTERLRAAPGIDLSVLSTRLELLITLTSRAPLLVPDGAAALTKLQIPGDGSVAKAVSDKSAPIVEKAEVASDVTGESSGSPDASSASWWDIAQDKMLNWATNVAMVIAKDLAGVISIQHVNDPNALLLSPEQGAQLRENLRARLLTAQLSLLMRQPKVWRDELLMVESIVQSRFDPKSYDTLAAINLVHELQAIPVMTALPDISGSFGALEATRSSKGSD